MVREESFDSFYRATRRQLLHQAFALTGDLPAAQSAVRDAYVGAWQHWRKVRRLDGPARLGAAPRLAAGPAPAHRPDLAPQQGPVRGAHGQVLDALSKLPVAQRRVLLLAELAGLDLTHAARELGVTRERGRRRTSTAPPRSSRTHSAPTRPASATGSSALDTLLDSATLPRGPIVRRAGRKRRQGQALVGRGRRGRRGPRRRRRRLPARAPPTRRPAPRQARRRRSTRPPCRPAPPPPHNLLDRDQIRRLGPSQTWAVTHTGNNTSGDGINTVCQQSRFADPDGYAAIVRSFQAAGSPRRTAVQTVEVSKTEKQAQAGFRTTVGWYAGCRVGRLQVLDAYRVDNIGDEADVLMVRIWKKPVTTMSVAVARTGRVTTSTVGTSVGANPPPAQQITQSLADAVAMLCGRSGSQDCAKRPTYRVVPPPPSGEERGILAVADLPPVGRIAQPWVGTAAGTGTR